MAKVMVDVRAWEQDESKEDAKVMLVLNSYI